MDVTVVISDLMAGNRGPDPETPGNRIPANYGIIATLDGEVLSVTLTFQSGSAYCCMEWGCHLGLFDGERWENLRRKCAEGGISPPARFQLLITGVIEQGARFFDWSRPDPKRRGWYAFEPADANRYEDSTLEAYDTNCHQSEL